MATITNTKLYSLTLPGGGAPYGNVTALAYPVRTNDKGKWLDGDSSDPAASGDALRLGVIPAGFRPYDAVIAVNKAISGLAGKIGFAYADGVDDPDVPQDDDAFFAAGDFGTVGIVRKDGESGIPHLPKDAFLELTTTGAPSAAGEAYVVIIGIAEGQP